MAQPMGSGRGYRMSDQPANVLAQPPRSAVRNWHNPNPTTSQPSPSQPSQPGRFRSMFTRNSNNNNNAAQQNGSAAPSAPPAQNGPSSAQLANPINFNQRSNVNTLPPTNYEQPQQQQQYYPSGAEAYGTAPKGISFSPAMNPDGTQPSFFQRCFPRSRWYALTTAIAVVLTIIFIVELIVGASKFDGAVVSGNSEGGPSVCTLLYMGASYTPLIRGNPPLDVWRLISPIFLHAGFLHIIFNLYFIIYIGYVLEDRLYNQRYSAYWLSGFLFLNVFLFTGIMGNLFSSVLTPLTISVGASGACFGFLGFDLVYLIWNWPEIPQNKYEACALTFILVLNMIISIGSSSINLYAHLGGLICGIVMGIWLSPVITPRFNSKHIANGIHGFGAFLTLGLFLLMLLLLFSGNPCNKLGLGAYCDQPLYNGVDQIGCGTT